MAIPVPAAVIDSAIEIVKKTFNFNDILWYVPHNNPKMVQDAILPKNIISTGPTKLSYIERSVLDIDVTVEQFWTFELELESGKIVPLYFKVGFQERSRLVDHCVDNDVFLRPTVSTAQ